MTKENVADGLHSETKSRATLFEKANSFPNIITEKAVLQDRGGRISNRGQNGDEQFQMSVRHRSVRHDTTRRSPHKNQRIKRGGTP